jgi:hypothetical protein
LEAQREISMNKNIIAKPDSVLELTCFEEQLDKLADTVDTLGFSGNAVVGVVTILRFGSMARYLTDLVAEPLFSYINTNFRHEYVDNRLLGLDYSYGSLPVVVNGSYVCTEMIAIWNAARCLDYMSDSDTDRFRTLDWYTNNSGDHRRRNIDTIIQCQGNALYMDLFGGLTADDALDIAYNNNTAPYVVNNPNDTTPYLEDPIQTFLDLILPPPLTSTNSCGPAIPTGVTVQRTNPPGGIPAAYDDGVCANPGCYYVPAGAGLGTCNN